jgi:hypothetical protein
MTNAPGSEKRGGTTIIVAKLDELMKSQAEWNARMEIQVTELLKKTNDIAVRTVTPGGSKTARGVKTTAGAKTPAKRFPPNSMQWLKEQYLDDAEKVSKAWLDESKIKQVEQYSEKEFSEFGSDVKLDKKFGHMWNKYFSANMRSKVKNQYDAAKKEYESMDDNVSKDTDDKNGKPDAKSDKKETPDASDDDAPAESKKPVKKGSTKKSVIKKEQVSDTEDHTSDTEN